MRELEKRVFLDTRHPVFPSDREGLKNRILWEREEFVRDIMWKDRHLDLILADGESTRWILTLWFEPITKCFPETDMKAGSIGRSAWVYVKRDELWQVHSWS